METGRKTRLRRILRRKRIKRAIKAYGNYIAAGVLVNHTVFQFLQRGIETGNESIYDGL